MNLCLSLNITVRKSYCFLWMNHCCDTTIKEVSGSSCRAFPFCSLQRKCRHFQILECELPFIDISQYIPQYTPLEKGLKSRSMTRSPLQGPCRRLLRSNAKTFTMLTMSSLSLAHIAALPFLLPLRTPDFHPVPLSWLQSLSLTSAARSLPQLLFYLLPLHSTAPPLCHSLLSADC